MDATNDNDSQTITFDVYDGVDDGSSPYVRLASEAATEADIAVTENADEIVIVADKIRILYDFPFGSGPSQEEQRHKGWIFEETCKGGFTRGQLARVIAGRYRMMYADKEKYGAHEHDLEDLFFSKVTHRASDDLYVLSVEA